MPREGVSVPFRSSLKRRERASGLGRGGGEGEGEGLTGQEGNAACGSHSEFKSKGAFLLYDVDVGPCVSKASLPSHRAGTSHRDVRSCLLFSLSFLFV